MVRVIITRQASPTQVSEAPTVSINIIDEESIATIPNMMVVEDKISLRMIISKFRRQIRKRVWKRPILKIGPRIKVEYSGRLLVIMKWFRGVGSMRSCGLFVF